MRRSLLPIVSHLGPGKRLVATLPAPGASLHGYTVTSRGAVPEKSLECVLLRHNTSGAHHLHVAAPDSNNTFAVTFVTVPRDSTGAPHILEHTALCGSERFPVRDPFFNMLNRSLQTFMNAFTGADYTMYPFSTQNRVDFDNLLSVYVDAAFFPKLARLDFLQEGHRLEFAKLDDPSTPLTRTGVVYNEMKGALADSGSLFREQLGAALYPTTTYGHNSGGDPTVIPQLTWEGLRAFHAAHYHPSNAWFYTYGDMDLAHHLEQIDRLVLRRTDALGPAPDAAQFSVPLEVPWTAPRHIETTGPPAPGQELDTQHKSAVVWLLPISVADVSECFALSVLSELLLSGPSAPMYRALLETRLGSGYAPMTGFEGSNKQPSFGFGLTGMSDADAATLPALVRETLAQVVRDGFSEERVESVLHQLELSSKHVTSSYGLHAGMSAVHQWKHGGDPVAALQFDPWIKELRARIARGDLWQSLIRKYLLDNPHCVVARQRPDANYSNALQQAERTELDALRATLTARDDERIVADSLELKRRQDQVANSDCLPTLSAADIPLLQERVPVANQNRIRVSHQPTNGISYLHAAVDASHLPVPLLQALPLWASLVTSQGADGLDHRAVAQRMDSYTGGISFSPSVTVDPLDASRFQLTLSVQAHCLDRNSHQMMDLVRSLLNAPDWSDRDNVAALVEQSATSLVESLTRSGHSYAARTAAAPFGRAAELAELWDGMSHVSYLSGLAAGLGNDATADAVLDELLATFSAIETHLRRSVLVRAQVNAQSMPHDLARGLTDLWGPVLDPERIVHTPGPTAPTPAALERRLFYPLPAAVNFVARALPTNLCYADADRAALAVGAQVLTSCFLHREIREKGGAYGGGCSVTSSGLFSFYSYRDPHVMRTVDTFAQGVEWMTRPDSFSSRDVLEGKLRLFSSIDKPVSPANRGLENFGTGITDDMRSERRARLLGVTKESIMDAFARHVLPRAQSVVSIAALGSEQAELPSGWVKKRI